MTAPQRDQPESHYTYADYVTWPGQPHYELIDGVAYMMAAAPTLEHQDIAGEIYRQVANQLQGKSCRVFISPVDVRLPKKHKANEQVDTLVQPDVLVVRDPARLDRRGVSSLFPPDL